MNRILISGGAGYVGSTLVPLLLKNRDHVTVLDTFRHGGESLASVCNDPLLELVKGDARDPRVLEPLVAKADVVIPLAALVGAPACRHDQTGAISTNRDAIWTLMGMVSPDQRVVYPNTNSGYGVGQAGIECDEDSPLNPISLYGTTKVEAENCVMEHKNSVAFRLATVFGISPRLRLDLMVQDFTWRAYTDRSLVVFEGHFQRNFIDVRDVARAFTFVLYNWDRVKGRVYNVGNSKLNMSKLELCAKIKEHVPEFWYVEADIGKDPDQRDYIVSNARIEAAGYKALYGLDDTIPNLLKLFRTIRNTVFSNV